MLLRYITLLLALHIPLLTSADLLLAQSSGTTEQDRLERSQDRLERSEHLRQRQEDDRAYRQSLIESGMSAAPAAIAKEATIITSWQEVPHLRYGTNGWTCLGNNFGGADVFTLAIGPICMDKNAMKWWKAWKSHSDPKLDGAGLIYVLKGGSSPSNTDPFATAPPTGKAWLKAVPHLMLVGVKLDHSVYSTDPNSSGPWIVWAGTQYEHLIIPVQ